MVNYIIDRDNYYYRDVIMNLLSSIKSKIDNHLKDEAKKKKFNAELKKKQDEAYRKARLAAVEEIAEARVKKIISDEKKGKTSSKEPSMFEKLTGQPFFIKQTAEQKAKGMSIGLPSVEMSDADKRMMGISRKKKK